MPYSTFCLNMRPTFPLFQSHIDFAHHLWSQLLQGGECVIDATVGNGHDTLYLARHVFREGKGKVIGFDIQTEALEKALSLLRQEFSMERIFFYCQSHTSFPAEIEPLSVALIVYNLGYLPGGDKTLTTTVESSLQSLQNASTLICPGGALSITCYPGHEEGKREESAIFSWARELARRDWKVTYFQWIQHAQAPSLFFIQRSTALPRP